MGRCSYKSHHLFFYTLVNIFSPLMLLFESTFHTAKSIRCFLLLHFIPLQLGTGRLPGKRQSYGCRWETIQAMENIVVVGYGTQRKSDVTGSLASISAKTIQERPAQNVLQAMQGKAAGVHVSSNLRPGELPVIRVRGNRSLTASNDPLYVVDG
ncbi:MAG: TonB-dependent receptor plug domain-containing protein, partial [Flavisolibacter sp.]|nr:TonB-dependent receptor plug domain-containing protein [Flavisolibacter sp.]